MQTNSSVCFVFVAFRHLSPLFFFLLFCCTGNWICMWQRCTDSYTPRRNKKKKWRDKGNGWKRKCCFTALYGHIVRLFHLRVKQIRWWVWKTDDYSSNVHYFLEKFQARGSVWADACTRRLAVYDLRLENSPSGLYCATMVTVCPAFFRAAAACSCVALDRSTPFTYRHTQTYTHTIRPHGRWDQY